MKNRRQQLLRCYEEELNFLRHRAAEFASQNPKAAARLFLSADPSISCPDPHVERLLEGVAYLTARVRLKFESEFPRFTQALLESIYPYYLCPLPSMTIVEFVPKYAEVPPQGYKIPRHTELRELLRGDEERVTPCLFRTGHAVDVRPIQPPECHYYSQRLADLRLPDGLNIHAAIRIRLRTQGSVAFNELELDRLSFYIHADPSLAGVLYEEIMAHLSHVVVQVAGDRRETLGLLPSRCVRPVGFDREQALLLQDSRCFDGYRLLQEYFAFPQRYMFFELEGLNPMLEKVHGDAMEIVLGFDRDNRVLDRRLIPNGLRLFCTPAVNLFPLWCDQIELTDRFHEFAILPDRTRPLDYEVHSVECVVGLDDTGTEARRFSPFYQNRDTGPGGAYFTVHRRQRLLTDQEQRTGQHPAYLGCDAFLSLVDENAVPLASRYHGNAVRSLRRLRVRAWCTNRHLPAYMAEPRRFDLFGGPLESIHCLERPTLPYPSFAEGEFAWRLIGHLGVNYQSLLSSNDSGVGALKKLLKLYAYTEDGESPVEIEHLRKIEVDYVTHRVPTKGPVPFAFARGLLIKMDVDDHKGGGFGMFLLGAVLERFFAKYASVNSFTQLVLTSDEGNTLRKTWPPRSGAREIV
ncbi:MAG: type VI secretion system baseplate subunit TssF [Verrucomicrobiae bacterium]|nr:type VI secretion system baseplate subunit TssF [Verrucomicrobiae bacterium]